MAFYQHVANWTYEVERASDFAWRAAETKGARPASVDVNETVQAHNRILCDPDGAPFALGVEQTTTF